VNCCAAMRIPRYFHGLAEWQQVAFVFGGCKDSCSDCRRKLHQYMREICPIRGPNLDFSAKHVPGSSLFQPLRLFRPDFPMRKRVFLAGSLPPPAKPIHSGGHYAVHSRRVLSLYIQKLVNCTESGLDRSLLPASRGSQQSCTGVEYASREYQVPKVASCGGRVERTGVYCQSEKVLYAACGDRSKGTYLGSTVKLGKE